MSLRFPGLLAPDLTEAARLSPTAGSLTLKMYGSSEATLTLPEQEAEEKGVRIRDWISIYTEEGLAGIFRVTNVSQPLKKQVDLTLLHGIDILSDSVWGEQTEFSGTKQEFMTRLLAQQTQLINGVKPWVLGTCEDTATVKRSINYDRLNTLLEGLIEEGSDYYFTYDQSVFPWRLNYVRIDNQVMSEFRMAKNIRSATITYNDADLCTRLFLTVSSETEEVVPTKKLNPAWVSDTATPSVPRIITENVTVSSVDSRIKMYENTAAQARWGIVVKTADIDTQDDIVNGHFESADAWAASFLARRSAPSVQIQVDGDDLSALTNEPWDRARLARLCQVALPAYGETFRERVLSITWPELFKRPTHVTLSLANTLPRFTESLAAAQTEAASASRSSRATARAQTKEEKEITTWSQHVQWQGAALDGSGIMTLYESGIDLDATGGARIYSLENGLQGLYGELVVQSQQIAAKVGSDDLQGYLKIAELSNEFGNVLQTEKGVIGAKIATAIDAQKGTSIVTISADKIDLTGYVTASYVDAAKLIAESLASDNGYIGNIKASNINTGGNIVASGAVYGSGLYIGTAAPYASVADAVKTIRKDTSLADGLIGFEFQTLTGTSWNKVNFNIADTSYYRAHVGIDAANLTLTEIGATPYNASDAAVVTGIEAGTADKYFLIAATPKDGDTVYKKFILPAASAPAVTTDPKISKKSWASGQIQLDASSDPNDPASVTIALTGGTTGSLIYGNSSEPTTPTGIKFDILEDLGGSTADTGADVVASVVRGAATVHLGTNNNAPAIVVNTPGFVTVGGQRIQVGVTHLPVTPGTATPNTPTWNSSTHKYAITADGSVSIGSDSLALTRGSLSGDFSPTHAFTYGFNECFNSVELTAAKTTINPGETVDVIPKMKGTWDASAAQAFSGKKLTITAAQAATVTPKVSKKSWASGSLTFEGTTASSDPTSAGVALGWVTVPNTSNGNAALSVVDKASPYSSAQPHTVLEKNLTLTCENDAAYLKDGGTTLAKVPNNKTISASIDSIALRTAGGVQYVYDDVERKFTAYLKATGTNVAEKTGEVDIPAASAIEHGKRLVSAVLAETASSAAAPSTLVSGKTYNLYRVVDGTRESAALAAYTVPEASTPSTGATRYVLNLDPLTLTAEDAANISQNSPLIKTTLASYTDGIKEKDRPIEISVNAWEIYQAGINQGMNGVVNVVKGSWSTSGNTSTVTLTPSAGQGSAATVQVEKVPIENNSSYTGTINLMDGSQKITSVSLRLAKSQDGSYVSLYYGMSSSGLNGDIYDAIYGGLNKTELARISVNGTAGGESTISVLKSIGDITLTDADVGTSVKYPLLTYQDGTKLNDGVNQIPVTVDASAVYLKGQSDGSNVQIEPVRSYGTATKNETLYTIQPSGNNSVMACAEIYVDVPDGVKSVSKLASSLEASTYNGWTAELGALSMSYPYAYCYATGENGKRYNFKIDASEVYNSGMAAGSGVQIEKSRNYGTVSSSGLYTINPTDGYGAMQEAKIYVNAPKLYGSTYNAGALSGSGTIYPPAGYDGMKAVSYSTVHDISADNPVARIGSTGSRVYIGSVSKSRISSLNNVWIGFTASCGGSSKSFYIQVTD